MENRSLGHTPGRTSFFRPPKNKPRKVSVVSKESERICGFLIVIQKRSQHDDWVPLFEGKTYRIGRKDECEVIIRDRFVSRFHCELQCKDKRCYVRSLTSVNYTKVNDTKISTEKQYELSSNDIINIMTHEMQFVYSISDFFGERRKTGLYYDQRMVLHSPPDDDWHPEDPRRIWDMMKTIKKLKLDRFCVKMKDRKATRDELALAHSRKHIEKVFKKELDLGGDMYYNEFTVDACLFAVGGCIDLVEKVCKDEIQNGLAIIRPPGHHSEFSSAEGFCYFNNVAIAARVASQKFGKKVIIVDWDVHHGNGTENIFASGVIKDDRVIYMSTHRFGFGFYPGSGWVSDVGKGECRGRTINLPLPFAFSDHDLLNCFLKVLLPIAYEFRPDVIMVSAGFDAVRDDPIGGCNVSPECYGVLTHMLKGVSSKLILCLEGGYNVKMTNKCVVECLTVLLGGTPKQVSNDPNCLMSKLTPYILKASRKYLHEFWDCMGALDEKKRKEEMLKKSGKEGEEPSQQEDGGVAGEDGEKAVVDGDGLTVKPVKRARTTISSPIDPIAEFQKHKRRKLSILEKKKEIMEKMLELNRSAFTDEDDKPMRDYMSQIQANSRENSQVKGQEKEQEEQTGQEK